MILTHKNNFDHGALKQIIYNGYIEWKSGNPSVRYKDKYKSYGEKNNVDIIQIERCYRLPYGEDKTRDPLKDLLMTEFIITIGAQLTDRNTGRQEPKRESILYSDYLIVLREKRIKELLQ